MIAYYNSFKGPCHATESMQWGQLLRHAQPYVNALPLGPSVVKHIQQL